MSREPAHDVLARHVDEVRAGRASLDESISQLQEHNPAIAHELRVLLETAAAIESPPPIEPDPAFRRRARIALVEAIQADQARSGQPIASLLAGLPGLLFPARRAFGGSLAVVGAALVFSLAFAGAGAVYAAQDALPGDELYPVKLIVEDVQLALATSAETRAERRLERASRRLVEADRAGTYGRPEALGAAANRLRDETVAAEAEVESAATQGRDVAVLVTRLAANLERQQTVLSEVQGRVPEHAAESVAAAAEHARHGLTNAMARLEGVRGAPETGAESKPEGLEAIEPPIEPAKEAGPPLHASKPEQAGEPSRPVPEASTPDTALEKSKPDEPTNRSEEPIAPDKPRPVIPPAAPKPPSVLAPKSDNAQSIPKPTPPAKSKVVERP